MRTARRLDFAALPGWAGDDHAAARAAFFVTAAGLGPDWATAIATLRAVEDPRLAFEQALVPVLIGHPPALVTGYYEPELVAALKPDSRFRVPLHALPPDLTPGSGAPDRGTIMEEGLYAEQVICWVESPIEAFLAQVQGSVRIRLQEGGVLRLGHAGKNGHPYRSIGAELIRRGEIAPAAISAQTIRAWCAAHPGQVLELLEHNPSYAFFVPLALGDDSGPLGSMGAPLSAGRSLAVDAERVPLGAPVWLELPDSARLTVAQDTGSAIRGAQRADLYCGAGAAAGEIAGEMKAPGRMVVLLPPALAERIAGPEVARQARAGAAR